MQQEQEQEQDPSTVTVEIKIPPYNTSIFRVLVGAMGTLSRLVLGGRDYMFVSWILFSEA